MGSKGSVWSNLRSIWLKPWIKEGYLTVSIKKRPKGINLHRLVGLVHIPNPEKLAVVDHIKEGKESKLDNCICNLQWLSIGDNTAKASMQTHTVKSPTGEVITFTGMKLFCRNNDLNFKGMSKMLLRQRKQYRGWTLCQNPMVT